MKCCYDAMVVVVGAWARNTGYGLGLGCGGVLDAQIPDVIAQRGVGGRQHNGLRAGGWGISCNRGKQFLCNFGTCKSIYAASSMKQ
jgi:hypothetical protein